MSKIFKNKIQNKIAKKTCPVRDSEGSQRFISNGILICLAFCLSLFLFSHISIASASDRYWIGGTGNWSDTAHWSNTDGGAGGQTVPTSADNTFFSAGSFSSNGAVVTLDVDANVGALDSSTSDQTFTITSTTKSLSIYGNITEHVNNSLYNFTGTAYVYIKGNSTITTNGRATHVLNKIYINGVGITVTNADDFNIGGSEIHLQNGTLNTNNKTISLGLFYTDSGTKTLTLGSSIFSCYGWFNTTPTNFTFNYNTSTVIIPGNTNFTGADTFYNLSFIGTSSIVASTGLKSNIVINNILTITGANVTTYRYLMRSDTIGTPRTITVNGTTNITNADFRDITMAGTANRNFSSQVDIGDAGGNSGITFPAGVPQYFKKFASTANYGDAANWFSDTGLTTAGRVPLPQDDATFLAGSFNQTTNLSVNVPRIGRSLDMSAVANSVTWTLANAIEVYGSYVLGNNITHSGTPLVVCLGRTGFYLDLYNKSLNNIKVNFNYTLLSDIGNLTNLLYNGEQNSSGTLNLNGYNVKVGGIYTLAQINLGSGLIELTYISAGNVFSGNGTVIPGTSTIKINPASGSANLIFNGAGKTYNKIQLSGSHTGNFDFTGSNTIAELIIDAGRKVRFTAGTTQQIGKLTANGTVSNPITIGSITNATHTLNYTGTGNAVGDYLNLSYSTATPANKWYATNSTDGGNNSGWTFATAPTNQDIVFASSTSKMGGASVTVVSSADATNNIWFAPSGTTVFSEGATMTTAGGTATSILAPATEGAYQMFVVNAAGQYSTASTATLTVDTTLPTVSTLSPLDNATSVATDANLVMTFSEAVNVGTGNITIKKTSDNSVFETIAVGDAKVTGTGTTTITINPAGTLASGTEYYVLIDATGFDDLVGNSYAGISSLTDWSFTTVASQTATLTNTPINYTGGVLTATASCSGGGVATIATGGTGTNAGSYPTTINCAANGNYAVTNGLTPTNGDFVITKINPSPIMTVNNSPVTYNGAGQTATLTLTGTAGSASNILVGGAATQTTAGSYAVTANFTPTDTTNYNSLTAYSAVGSFVINKATPTIEVSNTPQDYTGGGLAATISGSVAGTPASILTGGSATQTNAGTYAVTANFTPTDTTNYNSLTAAAAGDFVISKINPSPIMTVNNSPVTYNGVGQTATLTLTGTAGAASNILVGGAATQTTAGSYAVTANFTPTDTTNYNSLTAYAAVGSFVINKATPTIEVSNTPQNYTGSGLAATISGSVAGTPASILTGGSATQTNAGTYAVTANFTPTDTTNYNSLTAAAAGDFVIIDTTPPTVALTSAAASTIDAPFSVTATFSEVTTNFVVGDITVTNGTAGTFAGSGTIYTFIITPTVNGLVSVDIGAGVATDAAGNGNIATTVTPTYALRDTGPGGGLVFYISNGGSQGLEAATVNQSTGIRWYNGSNTTTGATATAVGTGSANTTTIINNQGATTTSYAAGLARAYNGGGKSDWFLPSKDELNKMYINLWKGTDENSVVYTPVSDFTSSFYWSSSEYIDDASIAWLQRFSSGGQLYTGKFSSYSVRAARAFTSAPVPGLTRTYYLAPPTITQSNYKLFSNINSTDVGSALTAQNTSYTLSNSGESFRLRLLMGIGGSTLPSNGTNFKLQYAEKVGSCDTGFVGESYTDVTNQTDIAYNNNFNPNDKDPLASNANDPTDSTNTVVNQSYVESNNFTNSVGAINVSQDGMWDFSLYNKGIASNASYCMRVVKEDGSLLDAYSFIPEVTTAFYRSRSGGSVRHIESVTTPDVIKDTGVNKGGGGSIEGGATPTPIDTGNCRDGIRNGNETGVDVGGRCGGGSVETGDLGYLFNKTFSIFNLKNYHSSKNSLLAMVINSF